MKNILLMSTADNPHTIKWAKSLSQKYNILIFSLKESDNVNIYNDYSNIEIISPNISHAIIKSNSTEIFKLKYFTAIPLLRKILNDFSPDIVHAHYASSYGLLAILCGVKELYLSLWGSDILIFPKKSFFHRLIIKFVLDHSKYIFSSSYTMKNEALIYTKKNINVIPFGIDINLFKKKEVKSNFKKKSIVIGTIKGLEQIYGIEDLIKAFKIVSDKLSMSNLELLIVGDGTQKDKLIKLANDLNIQDKVTFLGKVEYEFISDYHNMIDIFVALSLSESFGVAILEANSCEKPVVVSSASGLVEIVVHNTTGLIVNMSDPEKAALAIEKIMLNSELATKLGKNGRERVIEKYNWDDNVAEMCKYYEKAL